MATLNSALCTIRSTAPSSRRRRTTAPRPAPPAAPRLRAGTVRSAPPLPGGLRRSASPTVCASIVVDLIGGESGDGGPAGAVRVGRRRRRPRHRRRPAPTSRRWTTPQLLEQLAASRSERDAEQAAAGASQAQAEQAAAGRQGRGRGRGGRRGRGRSSGAGSRRGRGRGGRQSGRGRRLPRRRPPAPSRRSATAPVPVRPQAQAAANAVVSNVPGAAGITHRWHARPARPTRAATRPGSRWTTWCSPNGALGDAIVAYHIAHWDELGVEYIIYQQRMLSSPGGSWSGDGEPREPDGQPHGPRRT